VKRGKKRQRNGRKRRDTDYALHSPIAWLHSPRSCCHDHEQRGYGRGSCRFHGLPDFRPETRLQRCAGSARPPALQRRHQSLHHLAFHLSKRILHFGATAAVKKKSVWGPPPSLARCIRPQPYGPCYPHDRLRPSGT
jgi:hypothetical protein